MMGFSCKVCNYCLYDQFQGSSSTYCDIQDILDPVHLCGKFAWHNYELNSTIKANDLSKVFVRYDEAISLWPHWRR
jgi:hypothetical protein